MAPPFFGGGSSGGGGGTPPRLGYQHHQDTPAQLWVIAHGLGFRPAGVQVTDDAGAPVEGVVTHPDALTTHIHFDLPLSGTADLS
ncbi:MAG: hypothetical protein L6R48_20835 [Planctomycetes bacterium]|nr:hypothetical protein [Planctomycetota bacterium]